MCFLIGGVVVHAWYMHRHRGQSVGIGFLLPPCGYLGLNSGPQAWLQEPLSTS